MARRKRKTRAESLITAVVILIIAVGSFCYTYFNKGADGLGGNSDNLNSDSLSVYYIDVGQGDCELIVCGDSSVLVDAGEAEYADKVIGFIRDIGIKELDCIVSTHPHSDHAGSLPYVIESIGSREIIMPELTEKNIPTTRTYEALMLAVAESDAKVHAAKPGQRYSYGDINIDIFSPVFEEDNELNNMSIVFRTVYGSTSFLFTGDAEKQVESKLLADGAVLKSDVIKVPHHGSKTSSTEEFVSAVGAEYAVVCCGDGTKNHPHKTIADRWEASGAEIIRTDHSGTIKITSDGKTISVQTERDAA